MRDASKAHGPARKPVQLALAPARPDVQTISRLQELLADALRGKLIGFAYVGMHIGCKYEMGVMGEAGRQPIVARGIVALLSDELNEKARER